MEVFDTLESVKIMITFVCADGRARTIRGCGTDDPATNTCYQKAGFGGRQYVCSCDKDNCNSGTNLKVALATLSSFAFVALAGPRFML